MATLAEMTAWSIEEARAEIDSALPAGWVFTQSHVGLFRALIRDAEGAVQWSESNYDERLLLLDTFGWLWTRTLEAPTEGPWAPRRAELTSRSVQRHALKLSDPEDIDPDELAAVYSVGPDKVGSDGD
jgi:uncharacterized protein (DUF2235 family)